MRPITTFYRFHRGRDVSTIHRQSLHSAVDRYPLDLRLDLVNHSPTGFEWGYGGSGPAQAALAILADFTGDDDLASDPVVYQRFKDEILAPEKRDSWELYGPAIVNWLQARGLARRTDTAWELIDHTKAGPGDACCNFCDGPMPCWCQEAVDQDLDDKGTTAAGARADAHRDGRH